MCGEHVFFADKSSDDRVCGSFGGLAVVLSLRFKASVFNPLRSLSTVAWPL